MFTSLGDGDVSPSAYDTAWIARIPATDDASKPHFPTTLEWITKNQLKDGSWGDRDFFFLYERLACTLSCVLTLTLWGQDDELIAKGLHFLQTRTQDLDKEKSITRTPGFEIIFPSMLKEARSFGLNLPYDLPCLKQIITLREEKITRIPVEVMHSVQTTILLSLEAVQELVQWDRMLKLQSTNGSFLDSPAATAAAYLNTRDKKCLEYLTYIVRTFEDHAPFVYPLDTFERCWVVDTVQRLGIDHHFREEISITLDFLYRTDVLEHFKDGDDSFLCYIGETHQGVSDFFSLYRFSQIAFPGEKILKQAKSFAKQRLVNGIEDNNVHDKWAIKKALHKEIEWALKNPWNRSLPRLEARQYIDYYGDNDVWIGKSLYRMNNINNSKYLELAKLEHNKLHAMHNREANSIIQWWNSCGFDDVLVTQLNPREIHFSISATIYEPEFSSSRIAYTKSNCLEIILRDVFQSHESIDELNLFCQAINEWKPAFEHALPRTLKRVFMGVYNNMNDLSIEVKKAQGKDVFPYLHNLRKLQVQEYLSARVRKDVKQIVSFKEHVEQVKKGLAVSIRLLPSMFLMGNIITDNIQNLDHRSIIHGQLTSYLALLVSISVYIYNPVSEEWMAVSLYKKEHHCTEKDAIRYIEEKIDDAFAELAHEYLKPNKSIPHSCRRLFFEHGRIIRFYLDKVHNDHNSKTIERLYTPVQ
ncbi:hypothetical protein KSP40_PGU016703 [Platanthera guangdongensis]|uniref:Uncharacterized protein n=1 Tax=Platanthera guangdongensis TaxID=2320717 RepID=A0ABR2LEV8_9ASPA